MNGELIKKIENQNSSYLIGRKIIFKEKLDSTNKFLLENYERFPDGTIVIADGQTAGRGRLNRKWSSPPGKNLYLSILIKQPAFPPEMAPSLNIVTSLALTYAIENFTEKRPIIKWPNDVLFDNKKIAGILTEGQLSENRIEKIVIGVGININIRSSELPEEIKEIATSLYILQNKETSREKFFELFLHYFNLCYNNFIKYGLKKIRRRWESYFSWIDKEIDIIDGDNVIGGIAKGIDEQGFLIVDINGNRKKIITGDISIRRKDVTGY